MGTHFSNAVELPRYDETLERRARMRSLHARRRPRRSGLRKHVHEGIGLGWYLLRLTVHAAGFGLLLAAMMAVFYLLG
jgi:hypothetical protein